MINWQEIETVLLDMDGTLLDLHFDNYFWLEFLPAEYAEHKGLALDTAQQELDKLFKQTQGSLNWYCFSPWLAWALSVDTWDSNWSTEVKRAFIAESLAVHRQKCTLAAIRRVLNGALPVSLGDYQYFYP